MPEVATEPRWRRLPEERPQQILRAALAVFGEYGLAGARLEDIARRAGVSKGTIYLYFPNKEALFREMVRSTIVEAIVAGEGIPDSGSARDQLLAFMAHYWDFVRTPAFAVIYRVVVSELHHFPDLVEFYSAEVIARSQKLIAGIIRRGIAGGEFRQQDPAVAGRMLISLFSTSAMWCCKRKFFPHLRNLPDEQIYSELVDFYLAALRA